MIEFIGNDDERGSKILAYYKVDKYNEMTIQEASKCLTQLKK